MVYNFSVLNFGGRQYSLNRYSSSNDGATWSSQNIADKQEGTPSPDLFKTTIEQSAKDTGLLVLVEAQADEIEKHTARQIKVEWQKFKEAVGNKKRKLGCFFAVDAFSNSAKVTAVTKLAGSSPFENNFDHYGVNSLKETDLSVKGERIAVIRRNECFTPNTEAILSHIVKMIKTPVVKADQ